MRFSSRSSTRRPTPWPGSSWKWTPTTSSSRPRRGSGPPPPSGSKPSGPFYEEGRITIDRYLDAVSQYASAVAQEAQFKTTYNISIVALEEAKGTLLAYDNIAWPKARTRGRRTSRPATSRPPTGDADSARRSRILRSPARSIPTRSRQPAAERAAGRPPPLPAPVGPLGPPPTAVPPYRPAGEAPILSQKPQATPGSLLPDPTMGMPPRPAGDKPTLDGATDSRRRHTRHHGRPSLHERPGSHERPSSDEWRSSPGDPPPATCRRSPDQARERPKPSIHQLAPPPLSRPST